MKLYNLFLPGLVILSLICMMIFSLRCKMESGVKNSDGMPPLRKCPEEVVQMRRMWYIGWVWWLYMNYAILFFGFLASMMVLYINASKLGTTEETIIYSIIAASMTVLGYVVSPKKYITGCRKAFITLDKAMFHYVYESQEDNIEPLMKAAMQGEEFITAASDFEQSNYSIKIALKDIFLAYPSNNYTCDERLK